ncbi:MAG: hypothetical protein LBR27_03580 [Bifidobacteriaceae bacterium]|jgi:hypothetical protein|nr:hypothetical protein [Bifidobacteriaceae bacterium]
MTRQHQLIAAAAGLAFLATAALAGCSSKSDDVATLEGKAVASASGQAGPAGQSQKERAEYMARCLTDAGVPAGLDEEGWGGDQASLVLEPEEPALLCTAATWGCRIFTAGSYEEQMNADEAEWEEAWALYEDVFDEWNEPRVEAVASADAEDSAAFDAAVTKDDLTSAWAGKASQLLYLGKDYGKEYDQCLAESGYTEPEWQTDPTEELKDKQKTADAGAEWAACARENGFPQVQDPAPPVADEWQTSPMVLLPSSITEEQLRALLQVCPSFDEEANSAADDAYDQAWEEHGNDDSFDWGAFYDSLDYPTQPEIGFDTPGYDGNWDAMEDVDPATQERLEKLNAVLWEAQNAYYEKRYGSEIAVATAAPAEG